LFQLPGIEFDPKDLDVDVELYWDRPNPGYEAGDINVEIALKEFMPQIYIQRINAAEDVPLNVFASVDGSSYSAVRPLTQTLPQEELPFAEEQIDEDEEQPCCDNHCIKKVSGQNVHRLYCREDIDSDMDFLEPFGTAYAMLNYFLNVVLKQGHSSISINQLINLLRLRKRMKHDEPNDWIIRDCKRVFSTTCDHSSHLTCIMKSCPVVIRYLIDVECQDLGMKQPIDYRAVYSVFYRSTGIFEDFSISCVSFDPKWETFSTFFDTSEEDIPVAEEQMEEPGNQFQTPLDVRPSDQAQTELVKDFTFVDSYKMQVTPSDQSPSLTIPIDPHALGVYHRVEAQTHPLWRGNLRYRVLVQVPRTVAGSFTMAHVDSVPKEQYTLDELRQYPHSITMDNNVFELQAGWRRERLWLYTDAAARDYNGYLYMTFNAAPGIDSTQEIVVTLYVDSSNVQFGRGCSLKKLASPRVLSILPNSKRKLVQISRQARVASFKDAGLTEDESRLFVNAGFVYVNGLVRCPTCGIHLGRWEPSDNPILEHKRHTWASRIECPLAEATFRRYGVEGEIGAVRALKVNRGAWTRDPDEHPLYRAKLAERPRRTFDAPFDEVDRS
jgi:hypothetical protein